MAKLFEPAVTVAALIGLLAGMNPDMLHELMIAREGLETLLALVWFDLVTGDHAPGSDANANTDAETREASCDATPGSCRQCASTQLPRVHLHRALVHEDLREELRR